MRPWLAVLIVLILNQIPSEAHVPLMADGNLNITDAFFISDPGKSWAVYGFLQPNETHYYSFDFMQNDMMNLSLIRSADPKDMSFKPSLVLIGPGLNGTEQLPAQMKTPVMQPNWGVLYGVPAPEGNVAVYEPFGPSSFIELSTISIQSPRSGRYFALIYGSEVPGHYSLAVGKREEFGFSERITLPLQLISVYLWEGQHLSVILIPYLVGNVAGLLVFWRSRRRTPFSFAGTLAGFLFLATSASVISQCIFNLTRAPFGPEVYITIAFAVFHAGIGVVSIRLARGEAGILQRVLMAVMGTAAMLAGSGLIIGSVLGVLASFLPSQKKPAGPINKESPPT